MLKFLSAHTPYGYPLNGDVVKPGFVHIGLILVLLMAAFVILSFQIQNLANPLHTDQRARSSSVSALSQASWALQAYALSQGRLPCPAPLSEEGIARADCQTGPEIAQIASGWLPYRTLGLLPESGLDGWASPLAYHVDPALTQEGQWRRGTPARLIVRSSSGTGHEDGEIDPSTPSAMVQAWSAVIVSAGEDGLWHQDNLGQDPTDPDPLTFRTGSRPATESEEGSAVFPAIDDLVLGLSP